MILKLKRSYKILGITLVVLFILALPELTHRNNGNTRSEGSVRNGSLKNGYLIPDRGKNYSYFSPLSYYILNNAYTDHRLARTITKAYQTCENSCPSTNFKLMELSNKGGGKMLIHRTHQNGMSADFMVPKISSDGSQARASDYLGIFHYLLSFDSTGKLKPLKVSTIDFESIGRHIIALDDAARENDLHIRKIIFKIDLKDDFYRTEAGREVQRRGIYIVQRLSHIVDILHDDHYHIDFEPTS